MRKRKWKLLGTVLALAAAAACVLWSAGPRATRENFRRIRVGMSKVEVEAILGTWGDYTTAESKEDSTLPQESLGGLHGVQMEVWDTNSVSIQVTYDREGRVCTGWCGGNRIIDRGAGGNLLWRAERTWRRWFPEPPGPPSPTF